MDARQAFAETHMGQNFMTPDVEGYAEGNGRYVEVSSGRGIEHEPIYGVTVLVDVDGTPKRDWEAGEELSRMFHEYPEALAYVRELTAS